jgi:hypothetical protein
LEILFSKEVPSWKCSFRDFFPFGFLVIPYSLLYCLSAEAHRGIFPYPIALIILSIAGVMSLEVSTANREGQAVICPVVAE